MIADADAAAGAEQVKKIGKAGGRASFLKVNLEREKDIRLMIRTAMTRFKRLDILVNNARPKLKSSPLADGFQDWDLAMNVLLKAPAMAAQYAAPAMKKNGGGSVINIASINAFLVSHQPLAYHAAKGGLVMLTRYLADKLADSRVRVNAICPALVDLKEKRLKKNNKDLKTVLAPTAVPIKRASTPKEIAELALFLSSEGASTITGQSIIIDGGLTIRDPFDVAVRSYMKKR